MMGWKADATGRRPRSTGTCSASDDNEYGGGEERQIVENRERDDNGLIKVGDDGIEVLTVKRTWNQTEAKVTTKRRKSRNVG